MRILLTGAEGQLAGDVRRVFAQDEIVAVSHPEFEICDGVAVPALVERLRPDAIINTAAFHRVDDCEARSEQAFAVNAEGVLNLARAAERIGAVLVHFSTNYVFDGAKGSPYVETDPPAPLSVYGMSKLAGERAVQQYSRKYFLVRTCGLYGVAGRSSRMGNFVERMLRLALNRTGSGLASEGKPIRVVNDQVVNPTSTRDLAEKLLPLIHTRKFGLYHMANTGECSWYDFAKEIFRLAEVPADLRPTSSEAFGAKAPRPAYSVLDNYAFRASGFADFRPWQEALADYLRERQQRE